jgi:predicted N-acetyltransferase YhbS
VIRDATPADRDTIVAVVDAAFEGREPAHRIITEVVPEISLVAEKDGEIVGHTMLSRMTMNELRPFQLSPVSVAPAWQRQGFGSALVREALRRADAIGEPFVVLLGHTDYYPRFGFEPAAPLGILGPKDYGDAWMLAKLSAWDGPYEGRVVFPPAFDE